MKKLIFGFVLMVVLAMSVAHVHAQQGVGGTWTLTASGMSMQMVLTQEGDKVTGTIDTPHGVIQLKGDFSKGKLWLGGEPTGDHPVQVTAAATLNSDGALVGTLSANLMEIAFTAVRGSGASKNDLKSWHNYVVEHIFGVPRESASGK